MGFYLRKSVRVGPLRFNLSGSGIGASAGIKGFRVGSGPRGNYVHMGAHGIYYRATLPARQGPTPAPSGAPPQGLQPRRTADGLIEVESGDVEAMRDSSSDALLEEIRQKYRVVTLWPFAAIATLAAVLTAAITLPTWVVPIVFVAGLFFTIWLGRRDEVRKTVVLFYNLDPTLEAAYQALHNGFDWLLTCKRIWHLSAAGNTADWKRNAGATTLVRRSTTFLTKTDPPRIRTNIAVPRIPVGRQQLYLLPDRVLVVDGGRVGAVSYADLQLEIATSRFIETEAVPPDAEVVDHTWRYVNKSGGPDRRFKDNQQLPVVIYSELALHSASGLREILQTSNKDAPQYFVQGISALAHALAAVPAPSLLGSGDNPVTAGDQAAAG